MTSTRAQIFSAAARARSYSNHLELVRVQGGLGSSLEHNVRVDETIRGIVERERDLRVQMEDREILLQTRLLELERAATATEGLKKELEDANSMVTKFQELWEKEKEDVQNRMTSMEEKHQELVSELEKKDQVREVLLAKLRNQHKNSEHAWRDQLHREVRRPQLSRESDKGELRQDLVGEPERVREKIQDEAEKHKSAEREGMDAMLEEERRVARRQLERVEREHLKREEDLEGQLQQAREMVTAAETNLQEQQRKEQELLNQLEQGRNQAKKTETRLQQQLRKEQKEREEEQERFRVAIEEEKARVRQEFYSGFFENFTKEKALLMEGVLKDIREIREDIQKELKMKTEEKREENLFVLNEVRLEEEEEREEVLVILEPVVGEEWDSDVARD